MEDKKKIHRMHRQRLRKKYINVGQDGFAIHELLEMSLFRTLAQGDTNPIAHNILNVFPNTGVFRAERKDLCKLHGVGDAVFADLRSSTDLTLRLICETLSKEDLTTEFQIKLYVYLFLLSRPTESVYAIYMNRRGRILETVCLAMGEQFRSVNYVQAMMSHVETTGARRIVLCHSHIGYDPRPSNEDLVLTAFCKKAMDDAGVEYGGHYIVTERDCTVVPLI